MPQSSDESVFERGAGIAPSGLSEIAKTLLIGCVFVAMFFTIIGALKGWMDGEIDFLKFKTLCIRAVVFGMFTMAVLGLS